MTCALLSKHCFSAHPTENVRGKTCSAQRYQYERHPRREREIGEREGSLHRHLIPPKQLFKWRTLVCSAYVELLCFFIGGWEHRSKNKACLTVLTFRYIQTYIHKSPNIFTESRSHFPDSASKSSKIK